LGTRPSSIGSGSETKAPTSRTLGGIAHGGGGVSDWEGEGGAGEQGMTSGEVERTREGKVREMSDEVVRTESEVAGRQAGAGESSDRILPTTPTGFDGDATTRRRAVSLPRAPAHVRDARAQQQHCRVVGRALERAKWSVPHEADAPPLGWRQRGREPLTGDGRDGEHELHPQHAQDQVPRRQPQRRLALARLEVGHVPLERLPRKQARLARARARADSPALEHAELGPDVLCRQRAPRRPRVDAHQRRLERLPRRRDRSVAHREHEHVDPSVPKPGMLWYGLVPLLPGYNTPRQCVLSLRVVASCDVDPSQNLPANK
jgi:hypothetical protein